MFYPLARLVDRGEAQIKRARAMGRAATRLEGELKEDGRVLAESYDIVSSKLSRLLLQVHKAQCLWVFSHLHRLFFPMYNLEANRERENTDCKNAGISSVADVFIEMGKTGKATVFVAV